MINIFSNPEFRRNLWKEFSIHRLIAMPLILLLLFYFRYTFDDNHFLTLPNDAMIIIFFFLAVWGSGLAADAIFEEIHDRTWELQKMTPLKPWAMSWGKLFGKTSFVWYGTFFCSVAYFMAYIFSPSLINHTSSHHLSEVFYKYFYCVLTGLAALAFSLFTALLILRISPERSRSRIALIQVFTAISFFALYMLGDALYVRINTIDWYSYPISFPWMILLTQFFIISWLLIGIYRLMRVELKLKTLPWVFPLFLISTAFFCFGFFYVPLQEYDVLVTMKDTTLPKNVYIITFWIFAYIFLCGLTFWTAFFAPKNIVHSRRWLDKLKNLQYKEALYTTPAWVPSLLLVFFTLIVFLIAFNSITPLASLSSVLASKREVVYNSNFPPTGLLFPNFFNSDVYFPDIQSKLVMSGFLISLFLFLIRDIGILYFMCWNTKAKRAHLATIVYLIILYFFVPMLLGMMGNPVESPIFSPYGWFLQENLTLSKLITLNLMILLQGVIVLTLLYTRWKKIQRYNVLQIIV